MLQSSSGFAWRGAVLLRASQQLRRAKMGDSLAAELAQLGILLALSKRDGRTWVLSLHENRLFASHAILF